MTDEGLLPPWTKARLDAALAHEHEKTLLLTLSAGTVHKPPPRDEEGFPIFEAHAAAKYLAEHGVSDGQILTECSSYDTIGNAYFSRVIHIHPARLQRLLVITSEFHMPRLQAIFDWIYNLTPLPLQFNVSYKSTPNRGMKQEALASRLAREEHSRQALASLTSEIRTLTAFHRWLFTEHEAYAAGKKPSRVKGDVQDTY